MILNNHMPVLKYASALYSVLAVERPHKDSFDGRCEEATRVGCRVDCSWHPGNRNRANRTSGRCLTRPVLARIDHRRAGVKVEWKDIKDPRKEDQHGVNFKVALC
jgi:hypothetical protein